MPGPPALGRLSMLPEASTIKSWCLNPAAAWRWRDWGGDSVVIELRSGQTLQFDPLSAAVMACIEAGATELADVSALLAPDLGVEDDAVLAESLCTVLERLLKLGWIEAKPASA